MTPAETTMAHYTSLYLHLILYTLGPSHIAPPRGPAALPLCYLRTPAEAGVEFSLLYSLPASLSSLKKVPNSLDLHSQD